MIKSEKEFRKEIRRQQKWSWSSRKTQIQEVRKGGLEDREGKLERLRVVNKNRKLVRLPISLEVL